jgi:hypothetical protein
MGVGAGFSKGATNIDDKDKEFKDGIGLAKLLAKASGLPADTALTFAAEEYEENFGRDALVKLLRNQYTAKKISNDHLAIANVPWRRIYTTNYDDIVEMSHRLISKDIFPATLNQSIDKIPKNTPLCVHFNGSVLSLNRETIHSEIKLTDTNYLTSLVEKSEWVTYFRRDLKIADAVFFVGYALGDLDIKRLLFEDNERLKGKTFFILGRDPDQLTTLRVRKFGELLPLGLKEFAENINNVAATYTPKKQATFRPVSLIEYQTFETAPSISSRSFFELFLYGKVRIEQIFESYETKKKYYLERALTGRIISDIKDGQKAFVIYSELGNGKTLFLEGLRYRAKENGYRIFDAVEPCDETTRELETTAKLEEKIIIIFEDYIKWLNEIKLITQVGSGKTVLVLTSRTLVHDVAIDDLIDILGDNAIQEYNLDKFKEKEIDWIIGAFDDYGVWGDLAAARIKSKKRFITETAHAEFHAVLLLLLDSPNIGKKLLEPYEKLKKIPAYYDIILSVFILNIIEQTFDIDTLIDIWGTEIINSSDFRRNESIRHWLDFKGDKVLIKSSVASSFLLRNHADAGKIIKILEHMIRRCHELKYHYKYYTLFKSLMRFGNLQMVLPDVRKISAILSYYDSIKTLDKCKHNFLFWLQFAIACTVSGESAETKAYFDAELARAKAYFDAAYSYAAENNLDTFQIDNHYARFLLVRAMKSDNHEDAMDDFKRASLIVSRQILRERVHYPYRVARKYKDFYDNFSKKLSKGEIDYIMSSAKNILDKISKLPPWRQTNPYIRDCKESLMTLISKK